tara:strand:- start:222 stop:500 length:279 start_codon:yes stop_codon:yes gene_type:complete
MTQFKTFNVLLLIGSIIVAIILFKSISIATFLIIVLTGVIYNTSTSFINTNVATEHKDKATVQESIDKFNATPTAKQMDEHRKSIMNSLQGK